VFDTFTAISRQLICIVRCHWRVCSLFSTCNSSVHWHHVVIESDLRPKSTNNVLFKYAADATTLLVHECTDVEIVVEYQKLKAWARRNGMVINELKTKELVFHRPCPRRCHMGSPIDGIERVNHSLEIRLSAVMTKW